MSHYDTDKRGISSRGKGGQDTKKPRPGQRSVGSQKRKVGHGVLDFSISNTPFGADTAKRGTKDA